MQFTNQSRFSFFENLKPGARYTLLKTSELGFGAHATQFTHVACQFRKYAQYDDAVRLILRPKNKRRDHEIYFYERNQFAIFAEWIDINTDVWDAGEERGPVVIRRMKYSACDPRYFADALASTTSEPIFQFEGR